MIAIIALPFLAVLGVSSKELTARFVTWNVESYGSPPNLNEVFGGSGFDMIFLALQGVKSQQLYDSWKSNVEQELKKKSSQMYNTGHHKNNAHFMGHKDQYFLKFSSGRSVDYVPFNDPKDTAMMLVSFGWHQHKFAVIHGRVPSADDDSDKTKYYETLKREVNRNEISKPSDFFFIAGDISYFSDMLTNQCWMDINGTEPALGKTIPSNTPMPAGSSRIMYKAYRLVKLESYGYLGGSDPKNPLRADYKIDIDTSKDP